jgi:hypothetical protein
VSAIIHRCIHCGHPDYWHGVYGQTGNEPQGGTCGRAHSLCKCPGGEFSPEPEVVLSWPPGTSGRPEEAAPLTKPGGVAFGRTTGARTHACGACNALYDAEHDLVGVG